MWIFCGIFTIIGMLVLYPVYVNVCQAAKDGAEQKCEPHDALYVAFVKITDVMMHAEFWTALATIAIAYFTYTLKRSTDNLWDATRKTAITQERDTKILQRAYLAVAPGGVNPLGYALPPYTIAHIVVQNVGNLPARDVSWFIDCKLSPDGRLNDFPINEALFFGKNIIPPGTEMKRSQNCDFDYEEVRNFERSDLSLYVWGEIRYLDGFGISRFTRFCHRYNKTAMGYGDVAVGGGYISQVPMLRAEGMRFHRFGNDAD